MNGERIHYVKDANMLETGCILILHNGEGFIEKGTKYEFISVGKPSFYGERMLYVRTMGGTKTELYSWRFRYPDKHGEIQVLGIGCIFNGR